MHKLSTTEVIGFLKANQSRFILGLIILTTMVIIPFLMSRAGVEKWTMIGIVITILALEITIVVEWDKIISFYQQYWRKNNCLPGQICAILKEELEMPEGRMKNRFSVLCRTSTDRN